MKRPLLLAAAISTSLQMAAFAQTVNTGSNDSGMSGQTQRMFIINSVTPGALTFSGTGTANFNNSVGTSNQFNVGSNTNLGVSASVSATKEFDGQALANFAVTDGTSLMQANGTASQAANQVAVMEQASSSARTIANSSEWGSSFDQSRSYGGRAAGQTTETQWKAGWESTYKTAYETASRSSNSVANTSDSSGIISGSFITRENANSKLSQSSSIADVVTAASSYADSEVSRTFGTSNSTTASSTTSQPTWWRKSSSEWESARSSQDTVNQEYNTQKAAAREELFSKGAQAAAASVATVSDSQVKVTGLGAIATVNTANTTNFKVDLDRLTGVTQVESTATANGSANSSLGTTSFATQTNQRTASAFMQAFAGSGSGSAAVTGITINPDDGNTATPRTASVTTTSTQVVTTTTNNVAVTGL